MCQGIHTGICNLFDRKSHNEIRVHDRNIRSNIKVGKRIFHACLIIRDNGERSHLCGCTGSRRDRSEFRFLSQFREAERSDQIFECCFRILVEGPHRLRRVDRGTTAHRYDPVRFELAHCFRASHNCLYGRIRLNPLKNLDFHSAFF